MTSAIINIRGGAQIDLLRPSTAGITFEAIVAGSRIPRFNAQTDRLVTVADHSCKATAAALVDGLSLPEVVAVLLHDCAEPLLGDLLGPLKRFVRIEMPDGTTITWTELEHRWLQEVCRVLLPASLFDDVMRWLEHGQTVKRYDEIALGFESMAELEGPLDWALRLYDGAAGRVRYGAAVERARDHRTFALCLAALHGDDPMRELRAALGVRA